MSQRSHYELLVDGSGTQALLTAAMISILLLISGFTLSCGCCPPQKCLSTVVIPPDRRARTRPKPSWQLHCKIVLPVKRLNSIAFGPEGDLLAVVGNDGWAALYDARTLRLKRTLLGHRGRVLSVAFNDYRRIHPSWKGRLVATAGEDREVRLWNVDTGRTVRRLKGHSDDVQKIVFDGGFIFATFGAPRDGVRIYDWRTGKLLRKLKIPFEHTPNDMVFTNQGEHLILRTTSGRLVVLEAKTGRVVRRVHAHMGSLGRIAISRDNETLVSAGILTKVWDLPSFSLLRRLPISSAQGVAFAFDPGSRLLLAAGAEDEIRLYDTATWRVLETLHGGRLRFTGASFHPSGKAFAVVGQRPGAVGSPPPAKGEWFELSVFKNRDLKGWSKCQAR